ncbi:NAD-dependent epimerase/dehydratase family protein [bacterium]|nr:NAD-dependent epimerase/dehydratase family protein [bacterium]
MTERVLITGGTGFIGSHAVEAFVSAGWTVRALVRNPDRLRWLAGQPVELPVGAVDDPATLNEALAGCDTVVHCAGLTKARRAAEFHRINAEGTRLLAEHAQRAGVRRFILCSSQAAAGPSTEEIATAESDEPHPITEYGRSKLAGERALRETAREMEWIILRPPAVLGPRDEQFRPLFQAVVRHGRYPEFGKGGQRYSMIGVHDFVRALIVAASAETGLNDVYFVANSLSVSWAEAAAIISRLAGRRVRPLRLNPALLSILGMTTEATAWFSGKSALLSQDKLREILAPAWVCSAEKIRRTWNFECMQSCEEVVRVTYEAYRNANWI